MSTYVFKAMDLAGIRAQGEVEADRTDQYLSLTKLRAELESFWTLTANPHLLEHERQWEADGRTPNEIDAEVPIFTSLLRTIVPWEWDWFEVQG